MKIEKEIIYNIEMTRPELGVLTNVLKEWTESHSATNKHEQITNILAHLIEKY